MVQVKQYLLGNESVVISKEYKKRYDLNWRVSIDFQIAKNCCIIRFIVNRNIHCSTSDNRRAWETLMAFFSAPIELNVSSPHCLITKC